jgi:hypothetical protein
LVESSVPTYFNMSVLCQACERLPSSVAESADEPSEPYLVCHACHARLLSRSLRPLEWFNLAKRHSWQRFLLHDDFYDDDGTASQPDDEVLKSELFPMPSLDEVSSEAESLLDYSITQWRIDDKVVECWKIIPTNDVCVALNRRFGATCNAAIRSVVLEVAAIAGHPAADLVRQAWSQYPDRIQFWSLVQASAACLPFEDAFARAEQALANMPEKVRRDSLCALSHFKSSRVLQWIEKNAAEPSTEAWGRLAAASLFSWQKAQEWLGSGRPLNLIAIDALLAIAEPRSPFLRSLRPKLDSPPDEHEFRLVLAVAVVADPVPRVQQRVASLLSKWPALAGTLSDAGIT